jgi:hypothetical protein
LNGNLLSIFDQLCSFILAIEEAFLLLIGASSRVIKKRELKNAKSPLPSGPRPLARISPEKKFKTYAAELAPI